MKNKILIDKNLSDFDAVLDLAHELTHFGQKKFINPYITFIEKSQFVKEVIEGKGGEVDAFIAECSVALDFLALENAKPGCKRIYSFEQGEFQREIAFKEFYKLGKNYNEFVAQFQGESLSDLFPYISKENSVFFSAAFGDNYPKSALTEFFQIKEKICQNDKKRLSYFSASIEENKKNDFHIHKKKFDSFCQ